MTETDFDLFARRAGSALDRRGSLKALAAAAVVAAARPLAAEAGKGGKKIKRKCKAQGVACREFAVYACQDSADAEACEQAYSDCCPLLEACQAAEWFACAEEAAGLT
jgi:hypothetical protein